jgi:predicted MFS family arabinose efflux permease
LLPAAAGVGVMIGSLAAGWLARHWVLGWAALGGVMLQALLLIVFSQMQQYWLALPIWGLLAGAGVVVDIGVMRLRQATTPNHLLGRVTTVSRAIGFVAIPLSTLIGGALIDGFGNVVLVYGTIGALTLVIGVVFWFSVLGWAERAAAIA